MRRRAQRQRLDERDPQREARLGIVGQRLAVALSISASRSGRRRSASAAMAWAKARSSAVEIARGGVERRLERQALAQHRVEQRSAARREACRGVGICVAGAAGRAISCRRACSLPRCGEKPEGSSKGTRHGRPAPPHLKAARSPQQEPAVPETRSEPRCRPKHGGPKGQEPTRYGDWENKGIAWDF
jgi:hypothetical protein